MYAEVPKVVSTTLTFTDIIYYILLTDSAMLHNCFTRLSRNAFDFDLYKLKIRDQKKIWVTVNISSSPFRRLM